MDNRLTVCRPAHFQQRIVSWMVLFAPLLALFRAKPANESETEEVSTVSIPFRLRHAFSNRNRKKFEEERKVYEPSCELNKNWTEREERRKKEISLSLSYHHRPSTSSTNETRTELERRFSVDDHKKCRAVESIYRSLNLISRLSRKFNWFQSSITDELRYARGKGGDSFQSLLLGA